MKIGIMSDLHLGHRQYGLVEREDDFYQQLKICCDELNNQDCDMVIIAGDIFDKPNPSPKSIHKYLSYVGDLGADVIIAIKGNHTMLLRDNHYAVDELVAEEIEDYFLLEDERWNSQLFALSQSDIPYAKWIKKHINVDGITYRGVNEYDDFVEIQKKLASDIDDTDNFNILVVHQSFQETCGFVGEELSLEDIDYSPYDLIICGHIHSRVDRKLNGKTYFIQPGSIERLNTTEARDEIRQGKGVYIVDTDNKDIEFIRCECPRKFFIDDIEFQSEEEVEQYFTQLKETVDKEEVQPIIANSYSGVFDNSQIIGDRMMTLNSKNALVNNSIYHAIPSEDYNGIITENEIPPVEEAIKMAVKKRFDKKEADLILALFKGLNNGEDCLEVQIYIILKNLIIIMKRKRRKKLMILTRFMHISRIWRWNNV